MSATGGSSVPTPILVDSTVLIDDLRGHEPASERMIAALERGQGLSASVLSKIEVLAGMRSDERRRTRGLLDAIDWQPVTDGIAERAGALARRYRASHPGIDTVDYVIAATTEELGASLWTTNLKHFPMFTGLQPPY